MFCIRIVLPVRGGATISPRCPNPTGARMSIARVVSSLGSCSSLSMGWGSRAVASYKAVLSPYSSGLRALDSVDLAHHASARAAAEHETGAEVQLADELPGDEDVARDGPKRLLGIAQLTILPLVGNVEDPFKGMGHRNSVMKSGGVWPPSADADRGLLPSARERATVKNEWDETKRPFKQAGPKAAMEVATWTTVAKKSVPRTTAGRREPTILSSTWLNHFRADRCGG